MHKTAQGVKFFLCFFCAKTLHHKAGCTTRKKNLLYALCLKAVRGAVKKRTLEACEQKYVAAHEAYRRLSVAVCIRSIQEHYLPMV